MKTLAERVGFEPTTDAVNARARFRGGCTRPDYATAPFGVRGSSLGHYPESQSPLPRRGVRPRFCRVVNPVSFGGDHLASYPPRDLNPHVLADTGV